MNSPVTVNDHSPRPPADSPAEPEPVAQGVPALRPGVLRRAGRALQEAARGGSARFYVCLGVLVLSAATMHGLATWLDAHFQKLPVPLKSPLSSMNPRRLYPEYQLHPYQPPPISPDELETLGTQEYLNWLLVDRNVPQDDPASVAHLFISYYTGKPDMVPHVAEECRQASGATEVGLPRTVDIPVPGVGAPDDLVPVRLLKFLPPGRSGPLAFEDGKARPAFNVLYFFHVNGQYRTTRNEVRWTQSNLFDRYAYYAKVEVRFTDYSFRKDANEEQAVAAMGRLLRKLWPILLKDHLADWEALNSGAATDDAAQQR